MAVAHSSKAESNLIKWKALFAASQMESTTFFAVPIIMLDGRHRRDLLVKIAARCYAGDGSTRAFDAPTAGHAYTYVEGDDGDRKSVV